MSSTTVAFPIYTLIEKITSKHDVIRFMGRFPDKIMTKEESELDNLSRSKEWKCSTCQTIFTFDIEVGIPAPCSTCGGIYFIKK